MKIGWLTGFLMLLLGLSASAQTTPNPGLRLDDDGYEQVPYQDILTKEPLPSQFSFESFCPPVQAQGNYGTCVGFACGYYLRTILEAKARKLTNKAQISKLAFSPSYLYEKAKSNRDYACTEGVYLSQAFRIMKDIGVVPFRSFPYPACGQQTKAADVLAARYRIQAYERLFQARDSEQKKTDNLKRALVGGSPVVVGIVVPVSFFVASNLWQPAPTDDPEDKKLLGHALCVIGYDDKQYGGAFRIVNSFGKGWADGGFCWISYRDMARFTRFAYKVGE